MKAWAAYAEKNTRRLEPPTMKKYPIEINENDPEDRTQ